MSKEQREEETISIRSETKAPAPSTRSSCAVASSSATYYDVDFDWIPSRFGLRHAAQKIYPYGVKSVKIMEKIGEKIAWCFGLHESRYQYAVDEAERQERRRRAREVEEEAERQRRQWRDEHPTGTADECEEALNPTPYAPPIVTTKMPIVSNENAIK